MRLRNGGNALFSCGILLGLLSGCATNPSTPEPQAQLSPTSAAQPAKQPAKVVQRKRKGRHSARRSRSYVVFGKRYYVKASAKGHVEKGMASWYGKEFHGRKTSTGERFNMYALTAAHKTLPLPCYVEVTNLQNGRKVIVRVNDRGPFHGNRIIDLSYAAARELGMVKQGIALVQIRAIEASKRAAETQIARTQKPEKKPPQPAASAPKKTTAQKKVPITPARTTQKPTPASPALYVQAGAFGKRENAERLREELQAQLPEAVVVKDEKDLYRVHVGPLHSRDQAGEVSQRLAALGVSHPLLIEDR